MRSHHASTLKDADRGCTGRSLILIWQSPRTTKFHKVGQLDCLDGGKYTFTYLSEARKVKGFSPLVEFPELNVSTTTTSLPYFFMNRVMNTRRRGYETYLDWFGLSNFPPGTVPFESLIRTGGGRPTDSFHVVEKPHQHGDFVSRFFVTGVRYLTNPVEIIGSLSDGSVLELEREHDYVKNPDAVHILRRDGERIGYVPDWLCSDIASRLSSGQKVTAAAEQVNEEAPFHLQVLCRIEIRQD